MASVSLSTSKLVQYIVVRRDLLGTAGWSLGALIAQACHASTAALYLYHDHTHTQEYYSDLDRMHKVILEVSNESALKELSVKLTANEIEFKLWVEQPENYPTSLATRPYPQNLIKPMFTALKLFK
ncbi:Peptidyl-tRNA hydrolase [Oopsacas minuta]|uniref:peptidyl-tRNA hydrolase n=1 Tax=Oopsacas minuta TaxID=111878 RepID=A0AAV7K9E9_9METZ|nr:Peptidyl-tRNA hydrolase [Oopsacas minuta]